MNDPRTSPDPRAADDLERRLRSALHADAARAHVSPDAWSKVHRRLDAGRSAGRTNRRARRTFMLGLATVTAAAATFGVLFMPHLVRTLPVAGPNPADTTGPADTARPGEATAPSRPPTPAASAPGPLARRPTLAVATAGDDLRVRLELVYGRQYEDGATVRLRPYRWNDGTWTPLGTDRAVVGAVGGWPVDARSRPGVCELTVVNARTGGTPGVKPIAAQVRVRLTSLEDPKCTEAYDFQLAGDRLVTR
ncbi:hypothetical protein ABN028_15760 [Actinopolymorpha sp. B17G11]|uniref:hypothetical protein n=1 Tax=Actinopolymorpha sp. B17G11 TaxID=3160861 RepID=UPI0032E4649D